MKKLFLIVLVLAFAAPLTMAQAGGGSKSGSSKMGKMAGMQKSHKGAMKGHHKGRMKGHHKGGKMGHHKGGKMGHKGGMKSKKGAAATPKRQ